MRTVHDLRARVAAWREAGETVALVPTMGAIHAGHLSLVTLANSLADRVVTSLFVNPLQFGPREDFHAYPRDEARDAAALSDAGSDLLYAPDAGEMYPPGFSTKVSVGDLTEDLCGAARPNHFDGVATVVTKLLLQCAPGQSHFRREGLSAASGHQASRPRSEYSGGDRRRRDRARGGRARALLAQRLSLAGGAQDRARALSDHLRMSPTIWRKGRGADDASEAARFKLEAAGFRVDYVAVRDPETLKPLHGPVTAARVLAAVHLGKTRLIDNVPVPAR